eukprot:753986-Hanusia_phi.AAC.8
METQKYVRQWKTELITLMMQAFEMLDNNLVLCPFSLVPSHSLSDSTLPPCRLQCHAVQLQRSSSKELKLKGNEFLLQKTFGTIARKVDRLVNWFVVTERDSMILDAEAVVMGNMDNRVRLMPFFAASVSPASTSSSQIKVSRSGERRKTEMRSVRLLILGHSIGGAVAAILAEKYQVSREGVCNDGPSHA